MKLANGMVVDRLGITCVQTSEVDHMVRPIEIVSATKFAKGLTNNTTVHVGLIEGIP